MDLKLVPHSGFTKRAGVACEVSLPFDRVYLNQKMVGYLPHRDNAKFLPLVKMAKDDAAPIVRQLNEMRNTAGVYQNVVGYGVGATDHQTATAVFDQVDANLNDDGPEDEDDDE